MRILVTQHHPEEGPGHLGQFLANQGAELAFAHAWDGQPVPTDPAGLAAIISMGGPMNVYEEAEHPWLKDENLLLQRACQAGLPVLGVCLGAQLIAKALGAAVTKAPLEEIGWRKVSLTSDGQADPLFAGLGPRLDVLQWHGDTFAIPEGGRLLAFGDEVPHQAYVWGQAYGLQFHVEATPAMVRAWFPQAQQQAEMLEPFAALGSQLESQGEKVFANFLSLVRSR